MMVMGSDPFFQFIPEVFKRGLRSRLCRLLKLFNNRCNYLIIKKEQTEKKTRKKIVMQFNMKLLFQLRELLLKIQYCLIKVILIFNLQFILY